MLKKAHNPLDICALQHKVEHGRGDLSMPFLGVSSLDLDRAHARSFFIQEHCNYSAASGVSRK
jgi:hypothetical protein